MSNTYRMTRSSKEETDEKDSGSETKRASSLRRDASVRWVVGWRAWAMLWIWWISFYPWIGIVMTSVRKGGCSASEEEKAPAPASWHQKTLRAFQGGQEEAPTFSTWNPLSPLLQWALLLVNGVQVFTCTAELYWFSFGLTLGLISLKNLKSTLRRILPQLILTTKKELQRA